ncbi:MAG: Cna B-type domain-containing protein, partial [Clostridia bacterium]|nr:Cna B-type domain-containing protein [Clostridia bacterium]
DKGKAYTYEISYTTFADTSTMTKPTQMDNHAETDGGKGGDGHGQVVPLDYVNPELEKTHTDVDVANREVTWQVSFVVPAGGLTKAVLKDTYPNQWLTDKHAIEAIKAGTLSVTGLVEGEDYTLDTTTSEEYALITFTNGGQDGMKGAGVPRTIVATFKTVLDDDWLRETKAEAWKKDHTNNVELDYGTDKATDSDTVPVLSTDLKKTASVASSRTENGVELPVYKYEILLSGVTDPNLVIEDKFDTSLLEPYAKSEWGDWKLLGGDPYYQGTEGGSKVSYLSTSEGIEFRTNAASVPLDQNGAFFQTYKLTYYLTVKDAAALLKIQEAAAKVDGKKVLGNTATWGAETGTGDVTYQYDAITKEILTSDADLHKTDQDIWADYRITINPAGVQMNGGNPMEMIDSFENLSIDYTSIRATPSSGVSWDFDDNTATFTVPDETKVVITYRARVTFADIGEEGDTKTQVIKNTATIEGYRDDVSRSVSRTNSGEGAADIYAINLLKYQAGDMTHTLSGAVFQLLDSNKQPVKYTKDNGEHHAGDIVTYTTGSDGLIHVEGDQANYGWALQADRVYYLREIKAPKGYKLLNYDTSFTISSDGTTNYNRYIYHSGDTMSAKNYRGTQVPVKKVWGDGAGAHTDDKVTVQLYVKAKGSESEPQPYLVGNDPVTIELSAANNWEDTFIDLPLDRDKAGSTDETEELEYSVVEVDVNGEPVSESGYTVAYSQDEDDDTVQVITNTPEKGSLKVVKKIDPSDAASAH